MSSDDVGLVSSGLGLNEFRTCFVSLSDMTKQVARVLQRQGLDAQELHSDLSQSRRQNVLSAFRTGQIETLVVSINHEEFSRSLLRVTTPVNVLSTFHGI
jgi:superfamily II DNA helicase RecQ